jgi:predicted flap endonuclease-1-like 5' DNA nuclease
MSLLFRILYATHANGTHHKLALDALNHLGSPNAESWRRMFLKHAETYMIGSKAPDKEFKDFRNHVLHVEDNFWGGAPEKAQQWYDRLIDALKTNSWSEAVYCAGVLSHYYTDPIHPFHTAQSQEESNIHRAVEWSISKSYDNLRRDGEAQHGNVSVMVPQGDDWLRSMVIEGAETSNRYYQRLIVEYDFKTGVNDPPAGLNACCRDMISELLIYAADGFARILDRAFVQSAATPPDVELTVETVVAALKIPVRWVEKKLANAEDKAAVRAMYDELNATGKVDKTLSEDDRQVRDLHEKEVREPRRRSRKDQLRKRLAAPSKIDTTGNSARSTNTTPPAAAAGPTTGTEPAPAPAPAATQDTAEPDTTEHQSTEAASAPQAETVEMPPRKPATARIYLHAMDDIVDAPSIGPKTADRFIAIGIATIAAFLDCDSEATAAKLKTSYISADLLEDWKAQARLVMTVPGLRGTHAQLLQGAGFVDRDSLIAAEPDEIAAAVLTFATSTQGQRILRDGNPPDIEKIKGWVDNARAAQAA